MNFLDKMELNGNEHVFIGADGDHYYPGCDLTQLHAAEIANYASPWAWIKQHIKDQNFAQIHVGDWIPFTTSNGVTMKAQVAGIDTYCRYGDSAVGHHIDFISKTLWPTSFKMNLVNFNNGVSDDKKSPWLSSNGYLFLNSLAGEVPNEAKVGGAMEAVDYTAGGIYYYLPDALKAVIVEKRLYIPTRYSASGLQSNDNAGEWNNVGKLWLPTEYEIMGASVWGGTQYSTMGQVQYPIFANSMNRLKGTSETGRNAWWTMTAGAGSTTLFVYETTNGYVNNGTASSAYYAPACFRISA